MLGLKLILIVIYIYLLKYVLLTCKREQLNIFSLDLLYKSNIGTFNDNAFIMKLCCYIHLIEKRHTVFYVCSFCELELKKHVACKHPLSISVATSHRWWA